MLMAIKPPTILCGDYNAVPTELDAYRPERWVSDAVFFPETREAYRRMLEQGRIDALRQLHPGGAYTYLTTSETPSDEMRGCGWIISCRARRSPSACAEPTSIAICVRLKRPATTHLYGSKSRTSPAAIATGLAKRHPRYDESRNARECDG